MKIKQILGTVLVAAALAGFTAPVLANNGGLTGCPSTMCCPCGLSASHQTIDHGKCGKGKCKGSCKGNKGQKNKGNSSKTS